MCVCCILGDPTVQRTEKMNEMVHATKYDSNIKKSFNFVFIISLFFSCFFVFIFSFYVCFVMYYYGSFHNIEPTVIYGHCDCGCDRTGQTFGIHFSLLHQYTALIC